ncbi:MAG: ATP-binding cassette domain-containing protein [Vicinamibacterales bacterium]
MTPASVLTLDGLGLVRDGRSVLAGASAAVGRGELVALMGESGSGKTTLLRAVAGLDPFAAGSLTVGAVRLTHGPRPSGAVQRALYGQVGIVFQFHHLFANLRAVDNVALALVEVHGARRDDAGVRARALLDRLGVGHRAHAWPHELSGGEAQRVAIARALAVDPPLLLLDEPTASLDQARRGELAGLLTELVADGRTLIAATHDAEFARACATRTLRLRDGRLESGEPADTRARP